MEKKRFIVIMYLLNICGVNNRLWVSIRREWEREQERYMSGNYGLTAAVYMI